VRRSRQRVPGCSSWNGDQRLAGAAGDKAEAAAVAERDEKERAATRRPARAPARAGPDRAWEALDAMTSGLTEDSLASSRKSLPTRRSSHQVLSYYKIFGEKADDERLAQADGRGGVSRVPDREPARLKGDGRTGAADGPRRICGAGGRLPRGARIPEYLGRCPVRLGRVPGTPETLALRTCATLSIFSGKLSAEFPARRSTARRGALSVEPVQAPLASRQVRAGPGTPR